MKFIYSTIIFIFSLTQPLWLGGSKAEAAEIRCESLFNSNAPTASNLLLSIWQSGTAHPIYKRTGVAMKMAKLRLEIPPESFAHEGIFELQPDPGTTGLEMAGSYFAIGNVLTLQVWQLQIKTRSMSAFFEDQSLSYGARPVGLSTDAAEMLAAVEGWLHEVLVMNPSLRSVRLVAQDLRSESLHALLLKLGFAPTKAGSKELELRLEPNNHFASLARQPSE